VKSPFFMVKFPFLLVKFKSRHRAIIIISSMDPHGTTRSLALRVDRHMAPTAPRTTRLGEVAPGVPRVQNGVACGDQFTYIFFKKIHKYSCVCVLC
jgi:hypothetical protein